MSRFSSKQLELRCALLRRHKALHFGDKVMPDTENLTPKHCVCFPKCIYWNSIHHGAYSGMPTTGMSSRHEGRVPTKDIPVLIKETRVCLASMGMLSSNPRTHSKG